MIGSVLGDRYRVIELLGEGSMGQVYLVEHQHLRRREALKVLRPALASTPAFASRFRREARATNRVQHPNIVSVYDFGQLDDGRMYLAMEYAAGDNLEARLAESGRFSVRAALGILVQLADAVDHAHSRGVVHRDLKPGNMILVEHRGQPNVLKVLDFGIAKIVSPDYTDSLVVTGDRDRIGTPRYMAPEQFEQSEANPRSDIYAIGCIAYEMLTGEPPYPGTRALELMHAHRTLPAPRLADRLPADPASEALGTIVANCLAKEPAARFASGGAVRDALRSIAHRSAPGPRSRNTLRTATQIPPAPGSDFDDGETTAEGGGFAAAFAVAETARLDASALRDDLNDTLVELAEGLVDAGARDPELDLALARVLGLQDDIARIAVELRSIQREQDTIEQSAREREARLRFAVSELQFDRDQMRADRRADIDFQVQQLEQRVAATARGTADELEQLTQRAVGLAATRAELEGQLDAAIARLDTRAAAAARHFEADANVAPVLDRYRAVRDAVRDGEGA